MNHSITTMSSSTMEYITDALSSETGYSQETISEVIQAIMSIRRNTAKVSPYNTLRLQKLTSEDLKTGLAALLPFYCPELLLAKLGDLRWHEIVEVFTSSNPPEELDWLA